MKPSATLALSALLSSVLAQPLIEKRDETVIVTDLVIVTTDVTITLPATAAPAAATPKHANHIAYHAQGKAEAKAQPSPAPSPPPAKPAPVEQKAEAHPVEHKAAPPPVVHTSAPAPAPQGGSPEQIQAAANAKQEKVNNKQKQADFAHQSQMIAQQNGGASAPPAPAPSAPVYQAPQQKAAPPPSSGGGGGSGGSCGSIGGSCSGDVTIYNDQGTGACGWSNDTNSEDFFALAHGMFGEYTNDAPGPHKNAFCGRMASIKVGGKSFAGMLTDKCGGCDGASIDLSQHLFSQLYPNQPPGNGRYHNVEWEFTSGPIYNGPA